jgi:hypothetical protein
VRGGVEERLESGLGRIVGVVVAMCVSGANECCGTVVVAVLHGDAGEATETFDRHRRTTIRGKPEFFAEGVSSGIGLTGGQCCQPRVAAVDHPLEKRAEPELEFVDVLGKYRKRGLLSQVSPRPPRRIQRLRRSLLRRVRG